MTRDERSTKLEMSLLQWFQKKSWGLQQHQSADPIQAQEEENIGVYKDLQCFIEHAQDLTFDVLELQSFIIIVHGPLQHVFMNEFNPQTMEWIAAYLLNILTVHSF